MQVTVIGAGIMGTSVSQCLAINSISVELVDINKKKLIEAKIKIEEGILDAYKKRILSVNDYDKFINLISYKPTLLETSIDSEIVIECVNEDINIKSSVLKSVNDFFNNQTPIVITNTSCLSVSDLSKNLNKPENFIALHFFYPAEKNKLVEIIPHSNTDPNVVEQVYKLALTIGKYPIIVKDSTGFCINRFFVPFLNDSVKLLEKYPDCINEINNAGKLVFKAPFGAFDIMNLTGSKLAFSAVNALYEVLGEPFKPANLLIKKSKDNNNWFLNSTSIDNHTKQKLEFFSKVLVEQLENNLNSIINNKIASIDDIRIGARLGLAWKKQITSLPNIVMKEKSHIVKLSKTKDLARIRLCKPESLNCLDSQLFMELDENISYALQEESISAITIEGFPKVFCAGADIKFFIKCLENEDYAAIDKYNELAHSVLIKLSTSLKPVIAMIDGMAIGGGAELAISCNYIVTTNRALFSFPETTIGLFPAFGGSQRLPGRVGVICAKKLILCNEKINAQEAYKIGLSDFNFADPWEFYDLWSNNAEFMLNKIAFSVSNRPVGTCSESLSVDVHKIIPNSAIDIANRMIDLSQSLPLEEGLLLERQEIMHLFKKPGLVESFKNALNLKK